MSVQVAVREYGARKVEAVDRIAALARKYSVIAVAKLHKVRAAQLMTVRKSLRGQVVVFVAKNRLVLLGLRRAGLRGVDELVGGLSGQNVLLFTDLSLFQLSLLLERSKVLLAARAGDVATDDVVIPAGNTGLAPGPVLSEFKEANVPTRIDTGSIWVARDTVVAKAGDVIGPRLASLLARLGIRPIRAGLSVDRGYMDGVVLGAGDVHLDLDEYRSAVVDSYRSMVTVAVAVGYPAVEVLPLLLQRGRSSARAVAQACGYVSAETVGEILAVAERQAVRLLEAAKGGGYA